MTICTSVGRSRLIIGMPTVNISFSELASQCAEVNIRGLAIISEIVSGKSPNSRIAEYTSSSLVERDSKPGRKMLIVSPGASVLKGAT